MRLGLILSTLIFVGLLILIYVLIVNNQQINMKKIVGVAGTTMNNSASKIVYSDNIRWLRFDLNLNNQSVSYINNLTNMNFSILGIIDYQTLGLKLNANGCVSGCNWTLSDWNNTVKQAVLKYPNVHVWEIWNEPQFKEFDSGFQNGSPYNYYVTLKSAYNIIKSQHPNDTVLCLGGDNIYEPNGGSLYDYIWAQKVWSYGANKYCSAISLHAYSSFVYLLNQTPQGNNSDIQNIFNNQLNKYENLTEKPIWITETGIPSSMNASYNNIIGASSSKQSIFINQSMNFFLSKSYVSGVFWFNLYGNVSRPYNLNFGILNQNLSKKASYFAFDKILKEYN